MTAYLFKLTFLEVFLPTLIGWFLGVGTVFLISFIMVKRKNKQKSDELSELLQNEDIQKSLYSLLDSIPVRSSDDETVELTNEEVKFRNAFKHHTIVDLEDDVDD